VCRYPRTRKAPAVAAVHALSLGISKGEVRGWSWVGGLNACWNDVWGFQVFGLLGSNGAGKTTTVRATKRQTPMTRVKLQRKSAFNTLLRAGGYDYERAAADIRTSSGGGY